VALEQRPPVAVAEAGRQVGRADDVGEEDRRQRPFGLGGAAADQELLDLVEQRVLVADVGQMVDAVQLGVASAGDLLGQVAPLTGRGGPRCGA